MTFTEFIQGYDLQFRAELLYIGAKEKDSEYDKWNCYFNDQSFEYSTGIGHRIKGDFSDNLSVGRKSLLEYKTIIGNIKRPWIIGKDGYQYFLKSPKPEEVLDCLLSDSEAIQFTFEEWCSDFGFNSDSISDKKLYEKCLENGTKLIQIVGLFGLAELMKCERL